MYAFIEGTVEAKSLTELVVSAGGVGYRILCTTTALSGAPAIGETMRVYTFLNVREDALELFGFLSQEERALFLKLTGVTGIGPRTALGIVGSMPINDLKLAVMTGDIAVLSRAPGVGKKTAQRIALELKDKFAPDELMMEGGDVPVMTAGSGGSQGEAILALLSLGYTQTEAARAISQVQKEAGDAPADQLVRLALRSMLKG
ncbi:MAG TPA: Holliday junction branch migration protein RuvA [Clostridiales bacterium]|nr:Holliday junction branch migration protein RuvA [Clostridiales bacterium]